MSVCLRFLFSIYKSDGIKKLCLKNKINPAINQQPTINYEGERETQQLIVQVKGERDGESVVAEYESRATPGLLYKLYNTTYKQSHNYRDK